MTFADEQRGERREKERREEEDHLSLKEGSEGEGEV